MPSSTRCLCLALPLAMSAGMRTRAEAAPARPASGLVRVTVQPPSATLAGRGASQRFLVLGRYSDGRTRDLTSQAQVSTSGSGSVKVQGTRVTAAANGDVKVTASVAGHRGAMAVTVRDMEQKPGWSFANQIVPIFTKAGCNSGGCHGSPSGRGGFHLSLFGYEPDYDYDQVTKDRNGGRINKEDPARSLILLKPTMKVAHGGGPRFKEGSEFYKRIDAWLRAGAPKQPEFDPRLREISIYPSTWTLDRVGMSQPVLVVAHRDDGTTQDVTQYARFTSNDDQVADVDEDGVIKATGKGETSIMVRYLGGVGVVRVNVPRDPLPPAAFANFRPVNYIDQAVFAKLKEVRISPSDPASDAEFLRRAYIDTCGITPTLEEARAFLDDKSPDKRIRLVDQLLNRPEFVDYWTLRWSDLLRNNANVKQDKGLQVFYRWIRESVAANKPYDQMARELITASGSGYRSGPANWYNIGAGGGDFMLQMASNTSQVFLGIRIDCARCHNHPFEAWSQSDYYALAAFFAHTGIKNGPDENERIFFASADGDIRHPRTGQVMEPKLLGGDQLVFKGDEDRRERLAQWITSPSNPWFSRSIANRLWNDFFGRGIVHPVDDYRLTNPAANPALLDALAQHLVADRFDLKAIMRDILLSRTYQTTSVPNKTNIGDRVYASHALPRRLFAEVLLDAITYATAVPEKYGPYEYGRRAISIPDNRVGNGFLDLFGRAKRDNTCECERTEETNVSMVLNLINGDTLNERLRNGSGRVAHAVQAKMPPKQMIEEFYLATLSRRPTAKEEAAATKLLSGAPNPQEGAEDLMWGLLNMKDFLFNH